MWCHLWTALHGGGNAVHQPADDVDHPIRGLQVPLLYCAHPPATVYTDPGLQVLSGAQRSLGSRDHGSGCLQAVSPTPSRGPPSAFFPVNVKKTTFSFRVASGITPATRCILHAYSALEGSEVIVLTWTAKHKVKTEGEGVSSGRIEAGGSHFSVSEATIDRDKDGERAHVLQGP